MPDRDPVSPIVANQHIRVPVHLSTRAKADLLALAVERAPDATIFDTHPPTFFEVEASNKNTDSYFTRMMDSTLKLYAEDATSGVSFQDSHKYDGMIRTLGQSVAGRFVQGRDGKPSRTMIDFFTQPTLTPLMQEFVDRVRSGLARDVSVGFTGGKTMCSICKKEMYSWWSYRNRDDEPCWHIPGVEYDLMGKDGKPNGERVIAIGEIEDAHLSEVSTVFDGATPGAGIIGLKAQRAQALGLLLPQDRDLLEARYQIDLEHPHIFSLAGTELLRRESRPEKQEVVMPDKTYTQEEFDEGIARARAAALEPVRAALAGTPFPAAEDDTAGLASIRSLAAEITRLTPQAADGATYRTDMIDSVIAEGVRSQGAEYPEADERAELAALPIAAIKRRHALYAKIGDDYIGPGGRVTEDADGTKIASPTKEPTRLTGRRRRPAAAYGS